MLSLRRLSGFLPTLRRSAHSHTVFREREPDRIDIDPLGGERIIPEPKHTLTGVEESAAEYKFVERILPQATVPEPPKHDSYPTPSGWVPQTAAYSELPYFVQRTRFHNFPIYLETSAGGSRKMTATHKVEGDIWVFEAELREFLQDRLSKKMYTQVDEVCRKVRVRGTYVEDVAAFLLHKGL